MTYRRLLWLLLMTAILPISVLGQTYIPMPTDGSGKWHVESGSSGFMIPYYWFSGLHNDTVGIHDTVIGSYTYEKLYYSDQMPYTGYVGSYRSAADGKSWFVPRDSVNEYLIMDLGAQPGDTLANLISCHDIMMLNSTVISWTFVTYVVDSTGTFNSFNRSLKVIYGHDPLDPWNLDPEIWIESVGSLWGVLNCSHDGLDYDEVQCASSADTAWLIASRPAPFAPPPITFSFANTTCPFSFYTFTTTDEFSQDAFSVWPNPVQTTLHLNGSASMTQYSYMIMDISGRMLLNGTMGMDRSIDVSELSPGNYLLEISSGESMQPIRFVKTNQN